MRFESGGSDAKKKPGRKRGVSFYAAIVLCATAVVLAVATDRMSGEEAAVDDRSSGGSASFGELYTDGLAVDETAMSAPDGMAEAQDMATSSGDAAGALTGDEAASATVATTATTQTAPTTATAQARDMAEQPHAVQAAAPLTYRMPTDDGRVSGGFSGDELVYCATMCDWRVHNGIDIAGEAGGEVKACADGMVEGFAADMLYGNTAVIRHEDGTVIYYCGLNDTQMVSTGLAVKAGDVIGYIGEVPSELADGPHIHLVMMKDGAFIDPATVLAG